METGPAPDAAAAPPARRLIPFEFRATGSEYFRIWIVNLLLTLLTLGIYSAWAKVRRLRYLYGNTYLEGTAFEYHGQPLQILKGRLIAVAALAIYWLVSTFWPLLSLLLLIPFLAAVPWVVVRSRMFQMHMSSWRNIRFRFTGTYREAFVAYVVWAIAAGLSFYILAPVWIYKRVHYLLSNTSYGTEPVAFNTTLGTYYKFCLITFLLSVIALVGLSMGLATITAMLQAGSADATIITVAVPLGLTALLVALTITAYYESSFINAAYDGLRPGPHQVHCEMRAGRLAWIYITNALGMMLTLGLFFPWAKIRRLKYQFDCMQLNAVGSLDEFSAAAAPKTSATGEAIGEAFEIEFGL
ncbi:MAG TPA: YjgN family protein [Steroidobacteraceae bacterium]